MVSGRFKRAFRFPFRRREDVRSDICEEFEFHLGMRTEELRRLGLEESEARAQAHREFGDRRTGEEGCAVTGVRIERKRRLVQLVEEMRQDVVFGLRQIALNPGMAAVAIGTLAIAMAANTAIFSVVNALVLKPLPVAAPDELARIKAGETQMAWANYNDIRRANTVFSDLAAYRRVVLGLSSGDRPVRLLGQRTSSNFFSVLGVNPAIGRSYTPVDSHSSLVVLSDRVWRTRFGGDRSVVGVVLTLGGRPYEVVGVMPPNFRGVDPPGSSADLWLPVDATAPDAILRDRAESEFEVVGRLRPGVTHAQAAAELTVLAQQLRTAHPEIQESFARVGTIPVHGIRAFEGMARTLLPVFAFIGVLTILSGLVLLIGCANIAGLLIGRAASRRHEIALRLALGAGRGRLVRQMLTESLLLAAAGGLTGVLLASSLSESVNALVVQLPIGYALESPDRWPGADIRRGALPRDDGGVRPGAGTGQRTLRRRFFAEGVLWRNDWPSTPAQGARRRAGGGHRRVVDLERPVRSKPFTHHGREPGVRSVRGAPGRRRVGAGYRGTRRGDHGGTATARP